MIFLTQIGCAFGEVFLVGKLYFNSFLMWQKKLTRNYERYKKNYGNYISDEIDFKYFYVSKLVIMTTIYIIIF